MVRGQRSRGSYLQDQMALTKAKAVLICTENSHALVFTTKVRMSKQPHLFITNPSCWITAPSTLVVSSRASWK